MISSGSTPGHVTFGRIFLIGGILSAMGSAIVGYKVLDFMVLHQGTWDFQGASGVASVVPGMAGVILAGWAIYHQIRVSSPSYRAAEEILIDITEFRRTYSRMVSVIAGVMNSLAEDIDQKNSNANSINNCDQLDEVLFPKKISIKNATPMQFLTTSEKLKEARTPFAYRKAAEQMRLARVAEELLMDLHHSCADSRFCSACNASANSGRNSFARMSLHLLPLIDTIQQRSDFPKECFLDIMKVEERIDVYGAKFSELVEEEEILGWCKSVVEMIYEIDITMTTLRDKDLLSPKTVERALLHPVQSLRLARNIQETRLALEALGYSGKSREKC